MYNCSYRLLESATYTFFISSLFVKVILNLFNNSLLGFIWSWVFKEKINFRNFREFFQNLKDFLSIPNSHLLPITSLRVSVLTWASTATLLLFLHAVISLHWPTSKKSLDTGKTYLKIPCCSLVVWEDNYLLEMFVNVLSIYFLPAA